MGTKQISKIGQIFTLIKGTISIVSHAGDNPNNGDRVVEFKNCTPFRDCKSKINNTK